MPISVPELQCNFENGLCNWEQDTEDDFKHKYISPKINDEGQLDIWPEGFFDEWDKALYELF